MLVVVLRCALQDENGMWYNSRWSEQQWLDSWSIVAKRYANNSVVIGAGLRNEPRPTLKGMVQRMVMAGCCRVCQGTMQHTVASWRTCTLQNRPRQATWNA
jgi:hypothetical protein